MRGMVAWLVVGLLVISGCSEGSDAQTERDEEPTSSTSATPTTESEDEPASPAPSATEPLSSGEFCDLIRDVASGGEKETGAATLELLQRGLPEGLDGDAKQGLQVLLDHATEFGSVRESWRTYRELEKGERSDLRALTWWVTKTCGPGYLDDLIPDLPEMPELPNWLTDPKIPGQG